MKNAILTLNEIARIISIKEDAFLRKRFPNVGSGSQFRTLIAISEHPNSTPSILSNHLGLTKASLTVLTATLLKAKLIVSQPNVRDKRSHFLRLTNNGRALLKRAVPKHAKMLEDFLPDAATSKKLNAWLRALKPESEDE